MTGIAKPVILRLVASVVVLWGAATATFFLLQASPGRTVDVLLARTQASQQIRTQIIADYRLDDPLPVQYLTYLERLVTGDLGSSYVLRRPVLNAIGGQLPYSLQLIAVTLALTVVASGLLAVASANRRRWVQSCFDTVESLVVALPPFWLGLVLMSVFSFTLRWLPAIGATSPLGLVLPAVALAAAPIAMLTRVLREGVLRALTEPFALTARSRGLSELALRSRHVLRHAALPATALLGWIAGSLIGGAVIIEIVFARPGVGRLMLSAVQNKDMPVVTGVVLLAAAVFVVVTILVDLVSRLIDPRVRR